MFKSLSILLIVVVYGSRGAAGTAVDYKDFDESQEATTTPLWECLLEHPSTARTTKSTSARTPTTRRKTTTERVATTTIKYPKGTTFFQVDARFSDETNCGKGSNIRKRCVSWYLCKNSSIVTGGSFLVDENADLGQPKQRICPSMQTCCSPDNEIPGAQLPLRDHCETNSGKYKKPTQCGVRNVNGFGKRLEGDKYAQYGEFPWMMAVLLEVEDADMNKVWKYKAGGTLIRTKVVITAVQRLDGIDASELKVVGGEWNTVVEGELCKVHERKVADTIGHDDYDPSTKENNIMMLVLETPFEISAVINPICLPQSNFVFENNNQSCYATGWGTEDYGIHKYYQNFLKKVDFPVVPRDDCQKMLDAKGFVGGKLTLGSTSMCAGGKAGKDMCSGDGGSPLACKSPEEPEQFDEEPKQSDEVEDEIYYLAGIVTSGVPGGCGQANVLSIYEDVSHHLKWIVRLMKALKIKRDVYV